ncbi:MAG: methyltransferase [Myxococcales bacterium FL481]|nr:MAG: methyltransferase [Myxococcales bacterium FL481]
MVAIEGLNPNDPGIRLLADAVVGVPDEDILLAYCGDVPHVGPRAQRLVLDVREPIDARHRCHFAQLEPTSVPEVGPFGVALCWPRAHLGKDFSHRTFAEAALRLRVGGVLHCAVRKQKGAKSLADTLARMLGHVTITGRASGYQRLTATRSSNFDAKMATQLWRTSYEVADRRLGDKTLRSVPGVFSRREIDAGTAALIDHVASHELDADVHRVLDLCAGIGPLALWAASRWPAARVSAVETNVLAAALIEQNATRHGLRDRVEVARVDASRPLPDAVACGVDVAVCNPPTHASPAELAAMLGQLRSRLAAHGRVYVVVNRVGRAAAALAEAGATIDVTPVDGYTILTARW